MKKIAMFLVVFSMAGMSFFTEPVLARAQNQASLPPAADPGRWVGNLMIILPKVLRGQAGTPELTPQFKNVTNSAAQAYLQVWSKDRNQPWMVAWTKAFHGIDSLNRLSNNYYRSADPSIKGNNLVFCLGVAQHLPDFAMVAWQQLNSPYRSDILNFTLELAANPFVQSASNAFLGL